MPIRPLTHELVTAIMLDKLPESPAIVTDFGIESQQHYEALYYPVRAGEITAEQLDEALGNGPKLTELVRRSPSNPHKEITFRTPWEDLTPQEGEEE